MVYTNHDIKYGRVVSDLYKLSEAEKTLHAALTRIDYSQIDGVWQHGSHDGNDVTVSVGCSMSELDPWGFTDMGTLPRNPTPEQEQKAQLAMTTMAAMLGEEERKTFLAQPVRIWLVAQAA